MNTEAARLRRPERGLASAAAAQRLAQDGPNELPTTRPRSLLRTAFEVMREPMFLMLVGCCAVYLVLGEARDAMVLGVAVLFVIGITLYQEQKTEHALAALRDLSSPRALVIRDGERVRVAGREVVVGDWIVLGEGDRVPADALLRDASNLQVDESLLTGEPMPVDKRSAAPGEAPRRPGGEDNPCVYSGTLVTRGHGVAEVHATGMITELGRIGHALQSLGGGGSPLQRETALLVRRIGAVALVICAIVLVLHGLAYGDWLNAILASISVAMSLLPAEFPVVLSVFMALGAWRMSRHHVLTRRLSAIETLGAASVLCVDKTGTLTENRMTVAELVTVDGLHAPVAAAPLPEAAHLLVEYALLATRQDPFDPMERAIRELGLHDFVDDSHVHEDWVMVREYPLSRELLAMAQVWHSPGRDLRVIAAKGAPEAVAGLCHLDAVQTDALLAQVHAQARAGRRVLAVARATLTHDASSLAASSDRLPGAQHDYAFELLGLIALIDPLRPEVPAAVAACRDAGIRVLMITGDYPGTASSIARQAGLAASDDFLSGDETAALELPALAARLREVSVIARAVPEHKLRIVQAMAANGEVVAMTGDGVNDAPALRAADVGIAMGGRGTDVAREAADIVLTDDNFRSIVDAVRSGRRIYQNLRRAMIYIVAVHVPIAGLAFLPLLFGQPMLLLPAHIAFLELVIDPACSIAFEAEPADPQQMRVAPRARDAVLLDRVALWRALVSGILVMLTVGVIAVLAHRAGLAQNELRALSFVLLVLGNLALIVCNCTPGTSLLALLHERNRALWLVVGGTSCALALVLAVPAMRSAFRFGLPTAGWWVLVAALALALLPVLMLAKPPPVGAVRAAPA